MPSRRWQRVLPMNTWSRSARPEIGRLEDDEGLATPGKAFGPVTVTLEQVRTSWGIRSQRRLAPTRIHSRFGPARRIRGCWRLANTNWGADWWTRMHAHNSASAPVHGLRVADLFWLVICQPADQMSPEPASPQRPTPSLVWLDIRPPWSNCPAASGKTEATGTAMHWVVFRRGDPELAAPRNEPHGPPVNGSCRVTQ